ncbi:isochorismatase family cysteine hydrolase [uncultured Sphingomonas sp.]|uniref:isochorismatase family cysteine hydrolase n=1 Tax=uncultured Sphingomonas sp. TaxID=158754 RepID=UPI0025DDD9C6|nr:isochorismatase family cysteine hydrolase [uncultured Sphingomonas sp.]
MAKQSPGRKSATAPFRDAPRGGTALLILDMITELDFGGAADMRQQTLDAADAILRLRDEADDADMPVIYVNDNFGEWHSEQSRLLERALSSKDAREMVAKLMPREDDYFIIKPQFSGFYATNLPVLLPKLGVDSLIITGIAADICVLFTAADAHMRDYRLWIPQDAVAAETVERRDWALQIMKQSMKAEVQATSKLPLSEWATPVPAEQDA